MKLAATTATGEAEPEGERDQRHQGRDLDGREEVLDALPDLDAAGVPEGEQRDERDRERALARDAQAEIAAFEARHQDGGMAREGHGDGGDGAGLDHEEERPAVEEADQRPEGLAEVDVLAAGPREARDEIAVERRRRDRHDPRQRPHREEPAGGSEVAHHRRGDQEDAGADHRAGDEGGRVEKAEGAMELRRSVRRRGRRHAGAG